MVLVRGAMNVKHHGRYNRDTGQDTNQSIFAALTATDPMDAFATIDTGWREERSKRSVAEIQAMASWFDSRHYDRSAEDFR